MRQYQYHSRPGCGGCLLPGLLIILALGGAPLLGQVVGFLFVSGLLTLLFFFLAFLGFSYFVRHKISTYERSQTESHNNFVSLLVQILVKIAEHDGDFSKEEYATIINFFRQNLRYNYEQMLWAKELIKEAQDNTTTLEELLAEFKANFAYEPRLILLQLIYQVIFSGEKLRDGELELAGRIADYLAISAYDHQSIRAQYMRRAQPSVSNRDQNLAILGLKPGAGPDEIKKAYRKLSMQYHPDKVGHLGEEFQKIAEEKMKEINLAYHELTRSGG